MQAKHLDALVRKIPSLATCAHEIERAFVTLTASYRSNGKVLVCGNGGSASDAEHWAAELLKGFRKKRPLSDEDKSRLPVHLAKMLQGGLPIIPLTGFPSFSTAFANDVAPDLVFAQLVWTLGVVGDVFIGVSTSGDARNVCAAAETARAKGLSTIALTGKSGGILKSLCDLSICVPEQETYLIQEAHLPIYHCLSSMVEDEFFPD